MFIDVGMDVSSILFALGTLLEGFGELRWVPRCFHFLLRVAFDVKWPTAQMCCKINLRLGFLSLLVGLLSQSFRIKDGIIFHGS